MGEAVTDKQVVKALRPFVRGAGPLVDALREADPFGLGDGDRTGDGAGGAAEAAGAAGAAESAGAAGDTAPASRAKPFDGLRNGLWEGLREGLRTVRVPGTVAWQGMDTDQRTDWWVNRVGRFTALLTAVPGLGGALADRLPIQDTLGVASQGLLLCALAGERGITDVGERVRLLAWVLFDRDIEPDIAAGGYEGYDRTAEDARTEELTEDMPGAAAEGRSVARGDRGRVGIGAGARTLWRLGRSLLAIVGELEKRPSGRLRHQALGALPVLGMVGNYFGERSGLKRVAERAHRWFAAHT